MRCVNVCVGAAVCCCCGHDERKKWLALAFSNDASEARTRACLTLVLVINTV